MEKIFSLFYAVTFFVCGFCFCYLCFNNKISTLNHEKKMLKIDVNYYKQDCEFFKKQNDILLRENSLLKAKIRRKTFVCMRD